MGSSQILGFWQNNKICKIFTYQQFSHKNFNVYGGIKEKMMLLYVFSKIKRSKCRQIMMEGNYYEN